LSFVFSEIERAQGFRANVARSVRMENESTFKLIEADGRIARSRLSVATRTSVDRTELGTRCGVFAYREKPEAKPTANRKSHRLNAAHSYKSMIYLWASVRFCVPLWMGSGKRSGNIHIECKRRMSLVSFHRRIQTRLITSIISLFWRFRRLNATKSAFVFLHSLPRLLCTLLFLAIPLSLSL
jgi:hypothetical protein